METKHRAFSAQQSGSLRSIRPIEHVAMADWVMWARVEPETPGRGNVRQDLLCAIFMSNCTVNVSYGFLIQILFPLPGEK